MKRAPVIDRATIDMLCEMDDATEENDLLVELIDDFLAQSAALVTDIRSHARHDAQQALAASSHSLKGASLNIGALVLFRVCDKIELMARNRELTEVKALLPNLTDAFDATAAALTDLRKRRLDSEMIDDLLGDDLL